MSEYLLTKETVKYGVPEQKKFPLPDADHVRSAIKFFNYVEPKYEKELAKAILKKAEEFGVDLSEMNIGENNRFSKYLIHSELYHHGILGQKWGIRRFQNKDGSYTSAGKERRRKEDSYSDDYKKYQKLNKKNPKELSTKDIEEINRRDNAMNQYSRNRQGVGRKFIASLGNNILNGAAGAIGGLIVAEGMKYVRKKMGL